MEFSMPSVFDQSSLRTQGPIRRGFSFRHWSRGLFPFFEARGDGPAFAGTTR